ncbi:hypothetical protein ACLOJK_004422, partial [Asimina triloba]
VMMGAEPGIKMTLSARILWIDLAHAPETSISRIHHVIGLLGVGKHRLLFYDPLVEEEEFQMREPEAQSRTSSTWSGDDDMVRAEEVIFTDDGSRFRPFIGITQESALPLAPCRRFVNAPRHRLSHIVRSAVDPDPSEDERAPKSPINLLDSLEEAPLKGDGEAASDRGPGRDFDEAPREATPTIDVVEEAIFAPMSPIWSVGGRGSASSVGETPGVSGDVVAGHSGGEVSVTAGREGAALISESVSVVPTTHSLGSFSHISLPLSTESDLLFNGGGADDLNLLRDVLRDLPHLFIEQALAARESSIIMLSLTSFLIGMSEIEGPAGHRVSFADGAIGSASKSADAMLGSAAEPVIPVEGRAAEVVVPDSDEGSGGLSWRVDPGGSSFGPTFLLDVNVEFIEPFRELASSCSARLQRYFGTELVVLPALMQLLTRFRDYWHLLSEQITFPFLPEYRHVANTRFVGLQQEVSQLVASV